MDIILALQQNADEEIKLLEAKKKKLIEDLLVLNRRLVSLYTHKEVLCLDK